MEKFGVKIKGIVRCGDEYLIVKKWYDDRIEEPYQWEFLDTTLEDSDSLEEACFSYINTSTGIYVSNATISYTWVYNLGDNKYIGIAYLCEVNDEIVILSEDLVDYKWVKKDELKDYVQNPSVLRDMKEAGII